MPRVEGLVVGRGRHEFEVSVEGPHAVVAALDLKDRAARVGTALDPARSVATPEDAEGLPRAVAWANHDGEGQFEPSSVQATEPAETTE